MPVGLGGRSPPVKIKFEQFSRPSKQCQSMHEFELCLSAAMQQVQVLHP